MSSKTKGLAIQAFILLALPHAGAAPFQGGSDDCSSPEPIFTSPVQVDFDGATTGSEGQAYPACQWGGTTAFERDVWFLWKAPVEGIVDMHVEGNGYATDPRLAVYVGNSCASLPPLECNDDGASIGALTPWVRFEATAGTDYLIQVGLFPGSHQPPMGGALRWWTSPLEEQYGYVYDDGRQDAEVTLVQDGEIAWLQRFNAYGGSDVISAVWSSFGGLNGTSATAYVWEDPDDDGLPADAVLLASATTSIDFAGTNTLIRIPLPTPVAVSQKFFVGVSVPIPAKAAMVEVDDHEFPNWSWLASNVPGPFDASCLPCNTAPPRLLRELNVEGTFLLRAEGTGGLIATYCSAPPVSWGGLCYPQMRASGSPSFTGGGLTIEAVEVAPNRSGILFWGTTQSLIPFRGNLKCIANPVSRTPIQNSGSLGPPPCSGVFSFDWTPAYMTFKGLSPGDAVYAQHWFREPAAPTSTTGFSEAMSFVVLP
jgi:hypothetical protein